MAAGSLASRAGLQAGDCLLAVNGRPVRDVIDVQFLSADEWVEWVYQRGAERFTRRVRRSYRDELGLEFVAPLFDGLRECSNRCPFCFVRQMPAGLRPTLYIQDDDYRYSFLHGNFVTLTNLTEADWSRLEEQRLSPLYVSVHATDPALRKRLLGRRSIPPILEQLSRLIRLGITVHTQIVVLPQVNDGEALARSVSDLAGLYPGVASVGVVPVGLTRFHRPQLRPNTPAEADRLLAQVWGWQAEFRRRWGVGFVYASDEWYCLAGRPVPPDADYDGYPQVENGIGLIRLFLNDWEQKREQLAARNWPHAPWGMVTGTLFYPLLSRLAGEFSQRTGIPVELIRAPNLFFGPLVSVAGLLTAGDVIEAVRRAGRPLSRLILPRSMFDASGDMTLDDCRLSDFERALGIPTVMAGAFGELLPPEKEF